MEDKNNVCAEHKKLSKRYLAFYIIGLFSIALVIILLSYLTQVRASRELDVMNSQLKQKDSTMQGTQERLVTLQDTVKEQAEKLEAAEQQLAALGAALGAEADTDLAAAAKQLAESRDVNLQLALLERATAEQERRTARNIIGALEQTYGAGRLDGTAPNALLTGEQAARYLELKAQNER